MPESKYKMSISLNVLNHLGLNLYSNTPAVLAEVIANAWDADATEVKINFSKDAITVADNGVGMDLDDINKKYLFVGYEKRPKKKKGEDPLRTPIKGRLPMGRKGIGKLSLFSIAEKISVYSRKAGGDGESFLMDAKKIKAVIEGESESNGKKPKGVDPSDIKPYEPEEIPFEVSINGSGTVIKITDFKKPVRAAKGLQKRIARRFGVIGEKNDFAVFLDGEQITYAHRDYFGKARFLFQYGEDYSGLCKNLDKDDAGNPVWCEDRRFGFNASGEASDGTYKIKGWIAVSHRSNDLDDKMGKEDENLNKITIVVRGKVAQEDILHEHRLGGMFTKFIYGEITADFLDDDAEVDIATSSRQKIDEESERYQALKAFIREELDYIWKRTNKLKAKGALRKALANPDIRTWYDKLPKHLQKSAAKIFGAIDVSSADESAKNSLYADGILAFETLKMNHTLAKLDEVNPSNLDELLPFLSNINAIEAVRYHDISRGRMSMIRSFQRLVLDEKEKERFLQECLFGNLWLLDPAWERATAHREMEKGIQAVINGVAQKSRIRPDIRYTRVSSAHVIVELKKESSRLSKTQIEGQMRKYIDAVQHQLDKARDRLPLESICIVNKLPQGWDNLQVRQRDEMSLSHYFIKIMTYDELFKNAFSAYSKYIEAFASMEDLEQLIRKIRGE